MKKATMILVLLSTVALLAACGSGTDTGTGDAPAAPSRVFLSLGTAPTGGSFFPIGGALAGVATEFGPAGWEVTAEATQGSRENIRRLDLGELDFALSNAAITYFAGRGQASWDRAYEVRSVMTMAPNVALFVTREESGIKKIADLKGKRVVIGPSGAGFEDFVQPIIEAHGVTYDDFTVLNVPQTAAVDLLSDGSADAAFLGGAVPTPSITQASSSMNLYFVPFEPEIKEQLLANYPFYGLATIPAEKYRGQAEEFNGLNVGYMHIISSPKVDENVVYEFTKAIYENRAAMAERHAAGRSIQPQNVVRQTGTEFHPGAVRYYKEIGIWPEETAAGEDGAEAGESSGG